METSAGIFTERLTHACMHAWEKRDVNTQIEAVYAHSAHHTRTNHNTIISLAGH